MVEFQASIIAAVADGEGRMQFYENLTPEDNDYALATAKIGDYSEVLTTYIDTLDASADADTITAANDYTDGYAVLTEWTQAANNNNFSNVATVCVGGTAGEGDDAVTASSCWHESTTWEEGSNADGPTYTPTTVYTYYYDNTGLGESYAGDGATLEAVTTDDVVLGFHKTWACTESVASGETITEQPTDPASYYCARFLPKWDKTASADDLRFDADVAGQLGYEDMITITWVEASDDTYLWSGAFQAATVAGAAALLALTF